MEELKPLMQNTEYATYVIMIIATLIPISVGYSLYKNINPFEVLGKRFLPILGAISIVMLLSEIDTLAKIHNAVIGKGYVTGISQFAPFVSLEVASSIGIVHMGSELINSKFSWKAFWVLILMFLFCILFSIITLGRWAALENIPLHTIYDIIMMNIKNPDALSASFTATLILASAGFSIFGTLAAVALKIIEKTKDTAIMTTIAGIKLYKQQLKSIEIAIEMSKHEKAGENKKLRISGNEIWFQNGSEEVPLNLNNYNDLSDKGLKMMAEQARKSDNINSLKLIVKNELQKKINRVQNGEKP